MSRGLGSTRVRIMASRSSAVVVVVPQTPSVAGTVEVIPASLFEGADGAGPEGGPQGVGRTVQAVLDHRDGQALLLGRERAPGGLGLRQQGGQDVDLQRARRVLDHPGAELVDLTRREVLHGHGHVVGPGGDIGGDGRDHLRTLIDAVGDPVSTRPTGDTDGGGVRQACLRRIPRTGRPRRRRPRRRRRPASSRARRGTRPCRPPAALRGVPPIEPSNGASPKAKMPPSEATSQ